MSQTTEEILIGSIILDNVVALDACHKIGITEEYFENNACRVAWLYIQHLVKTGRGVDGYLIWQTSKANHKDLLSVTVTSRWVDQVSTPHHAPFYAAELQKEYKARKAKEIAERLLAELKEGSDPAITIAKGQADLSIVNCPVENKKSKEELYEDMIARCIDAAEGRGRGLKSPWDGLNSMLNGWSGGNGPYIIAARPGAGKSTLMMNDAMFQANKGISVAVSSQEMSEQQLRFRMLADECDYSTFALEQGKGGQPHWDNMRKMVREKHLNMPIRITEQLQSIEQFASWATTEIIKYHAKVIYLDYLQILTSTKTYSGGRNEEVGSWMKTIRMLDKQFKTVPFIILSQLNRGGEGRPTLKELRDSGSIEQDATAVIFINNKPDGTCECGLEKHRGGSTGWFPIHFNKARQRFENIK